MEDQYVIKYKCHRNNKEYTSPYYFTYERAAELIIMANRDFIKAYHWMTQLNHNNEENYND